jgi:predicted outer membrane repeat protein
MALSFVRFWKRIGKKAEAVHAQQMGTLRMWRISLVVLLAVFALTEGKTIYVDDDANGLNSSTSWQNAYKFLQDALADANASEKPVEIRVAQGVYKPDQGANQTSGDRAASFWLINGVTLKGGYAGFGEPDPNERDVSIYETILSGDLSGNDSLTWPYNLEENSYHVVTASGTDETYVLDGFTITAGNATGLYPNSRGGGIYNHYGNSRFVNCVFSRNNASNGGGMYNEHSSPTLTNCLFDKKNGAVCGGGVYNSYSNPNFINCVFSGNRAWGGGGMYNENSSPTLTNCTFSHNVSSAGRSTIGGGGIYNQDSNSTLTDCTFTENYSEVWGGAMYNIAVYNIYSNLTLMHCVFVQNSGGLGGGMANRGVSAKLTNCTFNKNSANQFCGGIYNDDKGSLTLSDCIFSGNLSRDAGGIYNLGSATVVNCSFTGNLAYAGGGMYTSGSSTLIDCTFSQNSAENSGGGLCTAGNSTILNCIFTGNSAGWYGGGISGGGNLRMANCSFSGNSAGKIGGGIEYGNGSPTLTNCTFAGNSATSGNALACYHSEREGPSNLQLINCILRDSGDEVWNTGRSTIAVTYSNIQGGWPGEGNINADPCFADAGHWDPNGTPQDPNDDFWVDGDYHLKSQAGRWNLQTQSWVQDDVTSPCIDAGDPASPIGLEPFPNGGIINMGAYGGTAEASKSYFGKPPCETIIAGDINGDCAVDFRDFAIIAYHWLEDRQPVPPPSPPPGRR